MDIKKIKSLCLIFENCDYITFPFTKDIDIIVDKIYRTMHIISDDDNDLSILENDNCKSIKIFIPKYYCKDKTFLVQEEFEEKIKQCDITSVELEYFDNYKDNIKVPWKDTLDMNYNDYQKNIFLDDGIEIYIDEK